MSTRARMAVSALALVGLLAAAPPAGAVSRPLSHPRVVAHLDIGRGQTPENITLEPDGSADVTFAKAAQVARISPDGRVRVLAQLPATPGASCPLIGAMLGSPAVATGVVRDHRGSLYVGLCTGSRQLQGIWRLRRNGSLGRVAALPPDGFPNGMALDERHGFIYVADSLLGKIWRVSLANGAVTAWASGARLAPSGFLGANGLKIHGGAVWVTNLDAGTVLRIGVGRHGAAGPIETRATGLPGIDDFAFVGAGDDSSILAAINPASEAVLLRPDGSRTVVLTGADGLSNPSSVAVRGNTVYLTSAAYVTQTDPNLLLARLDNRRG